MKNFNNYGENEINYLNARDGKLEMRTEDGVMHFGQTVEQISEVIQENGVYENLMGGSSLDFASEFGFKNDDDALSLWDDALIHSAKEEKLKSDNSKTKRMACGYYKGNYVDGIWVWN
tara:strand:+ start:35 stop:388 length:354 start_codon:yes stop_codon:yes gene_type:complete